MKNLICAVVAAGALFVTSGLAQAGTIDFDDGTDGNAIGAFYAAQGVTFTNGSFEALSLSGSSSPNVLRHTTDFYQPTSSNPIIATFSGGVTAVSILALDVGSRGARVDAYDAAVGGNLLDFDEAFGTGVGVGTNFTLSAGASTIYRIELYQPAPSGSDSGDGLAWDNLTFTGAAVPLPPAAFMGLGLLGGIGLLRRRRRRSA